MLKWIRPVVLIAFSISVGVFGNVFAAQPAPIVSGDKIVFPAGSLEPNSFKVVSVQSKAATANHVAGHIVWNEDLTVRIYTPVTGRVRELLTRVGATVARGAVLARLDSPDFGQVQADSRKASADLTLAARNLERLRELFEHGAVAHKEIDEAEDAYAGAETEERRAKSKLALFGGKSVTGVDGLYSLTTPIEGTVVERNINIGQELRPDLMMANDPRFFAPQFVVTDPRRLWVSLDATETELPFLKVGQSLRIQSRAYPDRIFDGMIETIGSSLDPATRTVKVLGSIANPDLILKAELYVDVAIEAPLGAEGNVTVDASSIFEQEGKTCVFLETAPNTFEARRIQTAGESGGQVLVRSGLASGEKIVSEGRLLLQSLLAGGNP